MATETKKYIRRETADVAPWFETCGKVINLIDEADGLSAEVHLVEIQDAKLHYHEKTEEYYYILEGEGKMILDDDEVELRPGVVVYVPRGVKHKAVGKLKLLNFIVPRGVQKDIHELE